MVMNEPAGRTSERRSWLLAAAFVTVIVTATAVGIAYMLTGRSDGTTPAAPLPAPTTSTSDPAPTSSPSASEDPRAVPAMDAYRRQVAVEDAVKRDGGQHPERFRAVAGGVYLPGLEYSARTFRERGLRLEGETKVVSLVTVKASPDLVTVHSCLDKSTIKVLDKSGRDVRPTTLARFWDETAEVQLYKGAWLVTSVKNKGVPQC